MFRRARGFLVGRGALEMRPICSTTIHFRSNSIPIDFHYQSLSTGAKRSYSERALAHTWVTPKEAPLTTRKPYIGVILHGIMGHRNNWAGFAQKFVDAQKERNVCALLVDLRNHGDSARIDFPRPHTLKAVANDVADLLGSLNISPDLIIGHSYGGKVAIELATSRPNIPTAWVLDSLLSSTVVIRDRALRNKSSAFDLMEKLRTVPLPIKSRAYLIEEVVKMGFSLPTAQWMSTNLRHSDELHGLVWKFNLSELPEMLDHYLTVNMYPVLASLPPGKRIRVVRAEKSERWNKDELEQAWSSVAKSEGRSSMHLLKNSGHDVHVENPAGLLDLFDYFLSNDEGAS